ncbi:MULTISPECIES: hypothetical protein [unclassified Modestobacter]|uniref:hypothetical protein n=1 Tax=unclassified Modestobacter TaxID=2643866 RepID=UPI0022A9F7D2|nr:MULTISPECIES: hypothetical protein [unclassified Modestobacter]MCZ2824249.1 hypothetical protein [Modestobacter sp. VKM Ac-2981]MCZ2854223.1 hypothetical protein [Modestobacter sp. VKM Ac-2982]
MTTTAAPPRAGAVLASGAATVLWYAMPDVISSRTARGWAKVGLFAGSLALSAPELRAASATTRARPGPGGDDDPPLTFRSLPVGTQAVTLGSAAAALALAARGVVAGERWAFRQGQARAAAGKRLPHTGPALAYGALTIGLWLVPAPSSDPA